MRLRLPPNQVALLRSTLRRAGTTEVGGQIFGEQIAPSDFRALELTVQKRVGTFSRFLVDLAQAARDAISFFDRTDHRYTRFNYVGEWHSHPSFEVHPSDTDATAMRSLTSDRSFRGNFVVLMITRLEDDNLIIRAWLFDRAGKKQGVVVELES